MIQIIRKFLILGSTGFIGLNLASKLVELGARVQTFSHSPMPKSFKITSHIVADIMDKGALTLALKKKPDVIINLVGFSGQVRSNQNEQESLKFNTLAHIQLLHLVKKHCPKARVLFSSSRLEYGKVQSNPVSESHPTNPLSFYGLHKLIATQYSLYAAQELHLDTVTLRSSNPYGPHREPHETSYNIVNYFIDRAKKGKPMVIYGKGKQLRDYLYIDDLVDAILAISENHSTRGQIYNIGSGVGTPVIELVKKIIRLVGEGRIRHISWPPQEKKVETGDYVADITKIKKDTGWQPKTSLIVGLKQTIFDTK